MHMKRITRFGMGLCLVMALVACGSSAPASAPPTQQATSVITRAGDIIVRDAWSRPTIGDAAGGEHANHSGAAGSNDGPMGVVYFSIENTGAKPVRLVSASSPRSRAVTMHQTDLRDGLFVMSEMTQGIVISPATTIEFKPASYHLMLEGVKPDLAVDDQFTLTLHFEDAGELIVPVRVRPF